MYQFTRDSLKMLGFMQSYKVTKLQRSKVSKSKVEPPRLSAIPSKEGKPVRLNHSYCISRYVPIAIGHPSFGGVVHLCHFAFLQLQKNKKAPRKTLKFIYTDV